MARIVRAVCSSEVDQAKCLFIEYAESLAIDLEFQGFDEELDQLPGAYAPPAGGSLLLAMDEKAGPIGCVALRRLDHRTCEMKRLYVKSSFTRRGIGRQLAQAVIREAQRHGYAAMRLDTLSSMIPAVSLYRSLGFRPIGPYRYNPVHDAVYMELGLADPDANALV